MIFISEDYAMLEQLKKDVFEACKMLLKYDLVTFAEGSVSGIDREKVCLSSNRKISIMNDWKLMICLF